MTRPPTTNTLSHPPSPANHPSNNPHNIFRTSYTALKRHFRTLCTYTTYYMLTIITLTILIHTLYQYALIIFLLFGHVFIPQTRNHAWYESWWTEAAHWTLAASGMAVFVRNSGVLEWVLGCWPPGLVRVVQAVLMVGEEVGCVRVVGAVAVLLRWGYLQMGDWV